MLAELVLLESKINPPVGYSRWWWVAGLLCVVGIAATAWWLRRSLAATRDAAAGGDALERLRRETLTRLVDIYDHHSAGRTSSAEVHLQVSAAVRRFAGIVTDGDADYQVLPQLRRAAVKDPRLEPVAELVATCNSHAFVPSAADAGQRPDRAATSAIAAAQELVSTWR